MAFFGCCSRRVFITSLTVFGLILLVSGTILTASHVFSKLIKDKVNEVSSIFIKIVFRIALKFSENVVFMNHINTGEGPYSKENYELKNGKLKIFKGNKIHDLVNNEASRCFSL